MHFVAKSKSRAAFFSLASSTFFAKVFFRSSALASSAGAALAAFALSFSRPG
jgi:hypothetical protein